MKINDKYIWELPDKIIGKISRSLSKYRRCKRNSLKISNICIIHLLLLPKCFMHVRQCFRFRAHIWQVFRGMLSKKNYDIKGSKNLFIQFLSLLKFALDNFLCPNNTLWYYSYQFVGFHLKLVIVYKILKEILSVSDSR